MGTHGIGVYGINSKFASGNLVFFEKAVGQSATGDVFTIAGGTAGYVKVGGTAQDIDFQVYGTGSVSAIIDIGAATFTLVGIATATNGAMTITNATATSSTTTGALIVTGGIATAADVFVGDDLFFATGAVINFNSGDVTLTHASNLLKLEGGAFNAGVDAAGVDVKMFGATASAYAEWDASADRFNVVTVSGRAITGEEHAVDITNGGTCSSGDSMVGLNVVTTASGSAASWVSGLYVKATQASKVVNGYICAAELELASTAAGSSDLAVLVLNSTNTLTGSPPACVPLIMAREYGASGGYANAFLRVFGDTGQGTIAGFNVSTLVTEVQDGYEAGCRCAIRCMVGSTPIWLLANETAPTS